MLADGRVRFRLWAPGASRVDLCLRDGTQAPMLAMTAENEGWFELITGAASVGSHYRYRIDGKQLVPDPASRHQPEDVHGPSEVVDPESWPWADQAWPGRPWEEAVIYELHIGTFTPEGTFRAAAQKLKSLAEWGVTAVQLMPVAEFPGCRDWGYDGVALFAPESFYGSPDDLKSLVQTAHALGLMVLLDVVYNHFGPEGNYLHLYAPGFFTEKHQTPWSAAIDFEGRDSHWVRQFFIHNALYWLEEFHLDGLRLDAVHAIFDDSEPHILDELAEAVRLTIGRSRYVHLVLENDRNAAHFLNRDMQGQASRYDAQWNDDIHHALHVMLTGETRGYYIDYADRPVQHLGRCLCEGFAYQGEPSAYRAGETRGEPSGHLPPTAFVAFLQNHDQVGNRAFGERIVELAPAEAVRAATAVLLLAPSPPQLFMGQEWGSRQPFAFFCDFEPALAERVTEGRRLEFARFPEFADPASRERIPDPAALATFRQSLLDWETADTEQGRRWLAFHRDLLALRHREITPRLPGIRGGAARFQAIGDRALRVQWQLGEGSLLYLTANFGPERIERIELPQGRLLFALPDTLTAVSVSQGLPGWSVVWTLEEPARDEQ
jgi:malto-oligosyltrehalose trehalohydrolase